MKYLKFAFVACAVLATSCQASESIKEGDACRQSSECGDLVCVNQVCVERCQKRPCDTGYTCQESGVCVASEPECTTARPCSGDRVCELGKCVDPECTTARPCSGDRVCELGKCVDPECTTARPCSGDRVCELGKCVDPECTTARPCSGDRVCELGKCVASGTTPPDIVCYKDADCGEGFGCDQKKCVYYDSCSKTRTCPGELVCVEGKCVVESPATCNKTLPCAASDETCVAGVCVRCSCESDETCLPDGSCVPTSESISGGVRVGESCTWSKTFAHCDGNRVFHCTDSVVTMTSCGANVCATTSEEGIGCYPPCTVAESYYGTCVDHGYGSVAFTHVCEDTPAGKVWTLREGYDECLVGCTNGRCNFTPPEFGQPCTATSYPDACQGDWLTYCYYSMATGTACSTYSDNHVCALPSAEALAQTPGLVGVCALRCSTAGETRRECVVDEDGVYYSMNYVCAKAQDGELYDFESGYKMCPGSCTDGECVE